MNVVIIGGVGGTNIGESLYQSALKQRHKVSRMNHNDAYQTNKFYAKFCWYFRGKRPAKLTSFGKRLILLCEQERPDVLISTGISPIESNVLRCLREQGVICMNYLTDDPWNSAHFAPWFLEALPLYHHIFSVRKANIPDLKKVGCENVHFLPFGFDEKLHYSSDLHDNGERERYASDVIYVGGADEDRVAYMKRLFEEGYSVSLYGTYWDRFKETKSHTKGQADVDTLRKATVGAKVAICLVRRANRDGNCMRTFEIPAVGTCMLTEDTEEHREIFGAEGEAVLYFDSADSMIQKLSYLLEHEDERKRLARSANQIVTRGHHTYQDRLLTMFSVIKTALTE